MRLVEGEVVLQLLELYAVDTIGPAPDVADTQDEPHASSMSDEQLLARTSRDAGDIRSVVIPEGVEEIGQGAFAGHINLQSLTLPPTLKRIGIGAFKGCKALEKVVLPSSIEEVMPYAFEGCSNLSEVTILGEGCHGTFYRSSFVGCPKQDIATSLQNFPSTVTLVNDAAFSEMFDKPAHELRALKFDARSDDRWSTSRSKGFRIVDHGVEGLNSFAGTTVDGQAVQFCIELNHDCTRGYYAIGGAPSASGQRPILEEGYLEPKADRFSSRDPSQKAIGNLVGDFSVYLYHCHLIAGPSIDGTSAAFLEDAYRTSVIPLVEEYRRVAADKSG